MGTRWLKEGCYPTCHLRRGYWLIRVAHLFRCCSFFGPRDDCHDAHLWCVAARWNKIWTHQQGHDRIHWNLWVLPGRLGADVGVFFCTVHVLLVNHLGFYDILWISSTRSWFHMASYSKHHSPDGDLGLLACHSRCGESWRMIQSFSRLWQVIMVVQYSKQMLGSVFSTRKYMGIMKDLICIFANQSEVSNNLLDKFYTMQTQDFPFRNSDPGWKYGHGGKRLQWWRRTFEIS